MKKSMSNSFRPENLPFYGAVIAIVLAMLSIMLCGCGHQVGIVGLGTGFRVGGAEYGVSYGEGLFGTFVTRDGVVFKAELDSTQGFTYDPSSNTYKGIRSVEYSVAPQVNGYAVEFARENPEVAKAYYEAMGRYYETRKNAAKAPLISDEKSKEATKSVSEVIKEALSKAKSIVDGRSSEKGGEAVFVCDGDCEYLDLTGNADIAYQLSIALKLLEYDGDSHSMADTGERYRATLEHFIGEVVFYKARGHRETPLRVKRVKVENKAIVDLMYSYVTRDGEKRDVTCPSCCFLDDKDAD